MEMSKLLNIKILENWKLKTDKLKIGKLETKNLKSEI
jgi:hypothetical protein